MADFAASRGGQILIGAGAGGLLGAAIADKISLIFVLIGAIVAAVTVAGALTHPGRAFIGLVLIMALIPTYATPAAGPILLIPAAGLSWLIAVALGWRNAMKRGRPFAPTGLDMLVAVFMILMYVSLQYSQQVSFDDYLGDIYTWLGPYLAARLLLQDCERPVFLVAVAFAAGTALVAPVALLETLGVKNPFLNFQFNGAEAAVWAESTSRLGSVRAEASFGHPIALSMFVSASALLSLGMAIYSSPARVRLAWLAMAGIAVAVQVMTVSRTGWVMLVIGVVLLGLTTSMRIARNRLLALFTFVALLLVALTIAGTAPKELQLSPSGPAASEDAEHTEESSAYRERLLKRALEPGVLGAWGNPYNKVTPAVAASTATDNAYIILADGWGLIPTFSLISIALGLLIAIALARKRGAHELVILPIVALVSLCGLFFVAFITQQAVMIWLLVGTASAASGRFLRKRQNPAGASMGPPRTESEPPSQRLEPIPERW